MPARLLRRSPLLLLCLAALGACEPPRSELPAHAGALAIPFKPWWDLNWQHRMKVTIDNVGRAELRDFPVLWRAAPEMIQQLVNDGYRELRFIDADGTTVLKHEVDTLSLSEVSVWVRVPVIDANSGTDFFWIYYGSTGAPDIQSPSGTWDQDFRAVWHLRDDPGTFAPQIKDSTANSAHGTTLGQMTLNQSVQATVGLGLAFDGQNDRVDFGSNGWGMPLEITGPLTLETWLYAPSSQVSGARVIDKWEPLNMLGFALRYSTTSEATDALVFEAGGSGWRDSVSISASLVAQPRYMYVVATWSPAPGTTALYLDGRPRETQPSTGTALPSTGVPFTLAGRSDTTSTEFLNAHLDEVRVSAVARSADWIAAQYQNMDPAQGLLTFSCVERQNVGCVYFDGGVIDADAGPVDAGTADAGTEDAGPIDAGTTDAGTEDAGTEDAGTEDAGTADAGQPPFVFTSSPPDVRCHAPWRYLPELSSPSDGATTFSLVSEGIAIPEEVSFDATTGEIAWTPTPATAGTHRWVLVAKRAGVRVAQPMVLEVSCGSLLPVGVGGCRTGGGGVGLLVVGLLVGYVRGRRRVA